ncbi:MAG: tetratricopeptide repeat protein [candidate division NC10 bacterium]|nr:tetratricopeptide repeat protein [candidate division NC10 bacterium]
MRSSGEIAPPALASAGPAAPTDAPAWLFGSGPDAAGRRLALLCLLPALVYIGTLQFDFVFDDNIVVLADRLVAGPWNAGEIFGSQVRVADVTLGYYRPLVTLSYRFDRLLWGVNPAGYHLTNLVWHILATALVYAAALGTGATRLAAWSGALSFGLLPAHAEVLGWIQGRVDLLATTFVLLAFLALLRAERRRGAALWGWSCLGGGLYLLALLAKEAAAPLPLVWAAWELSSSGGTSPRKRLVACLPRVIPLLVALLGYWTLRQAALGSAVQFPTSLSPLGLRLLALFAVIAEYGRILLCPDLGLNLHRAVAVQWDSPTLLSALLAGATLGGGLAALWWRARHLVLWAAWLLLMLTPPLLFIWYEFAPQSGFLTAERFLYLPSVGWCVLAGALFGKLLQPGRGAGGRLYGWATLIAVLAAYAGLNTVRLAPWADAAELYRAILRQGGQSVQVRLDVHNNLGGVYLDRGEFAAAHREFQAALRLSPKYVFALNNMGVLFIRQGEPAAALPWLEKAIRLRPDYADAYGNLGAAYEALGDLGRARAAYAAGLRLAPASTRLAAGLRGVGGAPGISPQGKP